MDKLDRLRLWLMLTTAIVVVVLSHKIISITKPTTELYYYAGAVILSLSAAIIAEKIVNLIFRVIWIRKGILGSKYVEGYWLLKTYPAENDPGSPLLRLGILCISYDDESKEFSVATTRMEDSVQACRTVSKVAHIRTNTPHIAYLNFFRLSSLKHDKLDGFSSGVLPKSSVHGKCPTSFEAHVSVQNEGITRRQFASRIPDRAVTSLSNRYGVLWEEHYLNVVEDACQSKTGEQVDIVLGKLGLNGDPRSNEHIEFLKSHITGVRSSKNEYQESETELEKTSDMELGRIDEAKRKAREEAEAKTQPATESAPPDLEEVAQKTKAAWDARQTTHHSYTPHENAVRRLWELEKGFTDVELDKEYLERIKKANEGETDEIVEDYNILRPVAVQNSGPSTSAP